MVKNKKPSPYFNFMVFMKPDVEKELGRTIGNKELSDRVAPQWNKMSDEDKAVFAPHKTNIKLDSFGKPLSDHVEAAEEVRKIKEDMIAGISDMIDLHKGAMSELEVVVVAVTDYVTTDEGQVFPAEVSLVRLTLGDGLDPKQYHCIINPPSSWPLGYAHAAPLQANATHRLPTEHGSPDCVGTDSLHQVADEIVAFLKQKDGSDSLSPVFTLEELLDKTRKTFKDSFDMEQVNVWCLENLLLAAFGALNPGSKKFTNTHARDNLVKSAKLPDSHSALGCKWHREERPDEVNFCSLNMAQRWGFLLLNALKVEKLQGVTLVAGRHWPEEVMNLATHQKRNIRRNMTSTQTNTANEGLSDSDTETGSVTNSRANSVASSSNSVASSALSSNSRRDKTWREIEDGPKTPVLQCSEEFPSLGGGKKQSSKSNGRGGASGFSRGAYGGPNGTGGRVSIKAAAACLVAKSRESLGRRQQGAAVESRGGVGSSYPTHVEEQLMHVNLNGGPSRTGGPQQRPAAVVEDSKKEPSKQLGRGRKK